MVGGGKKVLKTCGPGTLFNPVTMICDWPHSVYKTRPECKEPKPTPTTTEQPLNYTDIRTGYPTSSPRMYNGRISSPLLCVTEIILKNILQITLVPLVVTMKSLQLNAQESAFIIEHF